MRPSSSLAKTHCPSPSGRRWIAAARGETDEGPAPTSDSAAPHPSPRAKARGDTFSPSGRRATVFAFVFGVVGATFLFAPSPALAEFDACRATYAAVGLPRRLGDSDAGETLDRCFKG